MNRILIIQTAFIGDVILATPIVEKLKRFFPNAQIDFLLRKGNEELLENNPHITNLHVWNKKKNKYKNLWGIIRKLRESQYDLVINPQRFLSTGFITWFVKSKNKSGFNKNPLSFCYTNKSKHEFKKGVHEIDRNLSLITPFTDNTPEKPKLYATQAQHEKLQAYIKGKYVCISPASVWYTKQFPINKWVQFLDLLPTDYQVYLLGSPADSALCNKIITQTNKKNNITNLAGKLSLTESAFLMQHAHMNYVNDSAPLHLASATNAPVKTIFCSTTPDFGFGPLSSNSEVIEAIPKPSCKPCGIHGYKNCPEKHFNCAETIDVKRLLP